MEELEHAWARESQSVQRLGGIKGLEENELTGWWVNKIPEETMTVPDSTVGL